MEIYTHEKENWTDFSWDNKKVIIKLGEAKSSIGTGEFWRLRDFVNKKVQLSKISVSLVLNTRWGLSKYGLAKC